MQQASDLFKYLQMNVNPLTLNGNPMNGSQLYDYVLNCCDNLLSDQVPDPFTLSEVKLCEDALRQGHLQIHIFSL